MMELTSASRRAHAKAGTALKSVYFHGLVRADSSGMLSPRVAALSVYSALRPDAVMEEGLDLEKSGRR
jgi:hypothetical protein